MNGVEDAELLACQLTMSGSYIPSPMFAEAFGPMGVYELQEFSKGAGRHAEKAWQTQQEMTVARMSIRKGKGTASDDSGMDEQQEGKGHSKR
jgi:hypothetical protein